MKVSSRTIRNDIHAMNDMLEPYGACIHSIQAKGFLFTAEDPEHIREITRIDNAFFSRTERLRYLTFRLCESDRPMNLYDLEEEVFVSRTVLLSDIKLLRKKFSYEPPYIKILIRGDEVSLEQNEEKIRSVLLQLFHEDWDYTIQKNAFYRTPFIDRGLMDVLLEQTQRILEQYDIRMDDATLTALQLLLGITHDRVKHGNIYPDRFSSVSEFDPEVETAVEDLFALLCQHTEISYPDSEKTRICEFISNTRLVEKSWPEERIYVDSFPDHVKTEIAGYLKDIKDVFQADFSRDQEFVRVLYVFFQQLISGNTMFSRYQDPILIKSTLTAEYELAYLFQRRALSFTGRYLLERELCALALCFSGAVRQFLYFHPEKKLQAILLSHGNLAEAFGLKRRILESLSLYLDITEMAPLNFADSIDYSHTDLVFMTLRKKDRINNSVETVFVDDHPGTNFDLNEMKIKLLSLGKIWPIPSWSLKELLEQAFWNENEEYHDSTQVIRKMTSDYIRAGIAGEEQEADILLRESVSSFAIKNGLVFVHTLVPAEETRLAVMTLRHRIRWNDFKISTVIMAMFRKEDVNLLFQLKIRFCNRTIDPGMLKQYRTREELISRFPL